MERKRGSSKKKKKQHKSSSRRKRELVVQFRNLTDRYNQMQVERESQQVQGSLIGLISSSMEDEEIS